MGPHGSDRSLVELATALTSPIVTLDPDTVPPGAAGRQCVVEVLG